MLTKGQIKLIKSLSQKKFRNEHQLFVVEGVKGIQEFLNSDFELFELFTIDAVFDSKVQLITEIELKKISSLTTPNMAIAIFKMPKPRPINGSGIIVALDAVRDPGNLGTIIRLCDWFGVKDLVCGVDTVDCFNTKVVQATMGSLTRVSINYVDLDEYLGAAKAIKFGTFMNGETIYSQELPSEGIIIFGNEANGISSKVEKFVNRKISIPKFGKLKATESLNVATAAAIVLSEFNRCSIEK
ncbi:RNA methyltransferase [Flavobacteriales bacterium 34_180_T64]|nr:RNA methyltransferase [Flavobacteriales bacterium 34_180_T64]